MIIVAVLDTLTIIMGFVGGVTALVGNTWNSISGVRWFNKLTKVGWIAAGTLLLALLSETGSRWTYQYIIFLDRNSQIERENQLFWAARTSICWVVLEDAGARNTYDTAKLSMGRSNYEAVIHAQAHNPPAQLTIEQYGLARTEAWISYLEQQIDSAKLPPGTDCSKEFPERREYVHADPPSFWSISPY